MGDARVIAFVFGLGVLVRVAVLVNACAAEAHPSTGRVANDFGGSLPLFLREVSSVFERFALVAKILVHA